MHNFNPTTHTIMYLFWHAAYVWNVDIFSVDIDTLPDRTFFILRIQTCHEKHVMYGKKSHVLTTF